MDKDYGVQQVNTALEQLQQDSKTDKQRQLWENMTALDVHALLYALEATKNTAD